MEGDALAVIFHGKCLHLHTVRYKVVPGKNWCNAVQHMVSGLFDVVGNHVFKRQHALDIQITCSSDQILLVCILTGQLVSDQMAAVVQIFTFHLIVFYRMPARRLYLADRAALLRRHQILADIRLCHAAPSQAVQIAVMLVRLGRLFLSGKIRLISV